MFNVHRLTACIGGQIVTSTVDHSDQKSLATVPVDAQNTNEKDLKYAFLSVLFIVCCRLSVLAEIKRQRYFCLSVWLLKPFS